MKFDLKFLINLVNFKVRKNVTSPGKKSPKSRRLRNTDLQDLQNKVVTNVMLKNETLTEKIIHLEAALVIRGLGICGFDYSRVRKQGITANNKGIA